MNPPRALGSSRRCFLRPLLAQARRHGANSRRAATRTSLSSRLYAATILSPVADGRGNRTVFQWIISNALRQHRSSPWVESRHDAMHEPMSASTFRSPESRHSAFGQSLPLCAHSGRSGPMRRFSKADAMPARRFRRPSVESGHSDPIQPLVPCEIKGMRRPSLGDRRCPALPPGVCRGGAVSFSALGRLRTGVQS
jgi:hypothetical protein